MTKRKNKTIMDQLLSAITEAEKKGITRYRIAKESGVDAGQLCRIVHQGAMPGLDKAARIANAIGYELILKPKKEDN